MNGPVLIDVTGRSDIINLAHVRNIRIKRYRKDGQTARMGLEVTYSNGSEDRWLLEPGRWAVLEEILLDVVAGVT